MNKKLYILSAIIGVCCLSSCNDEDRFSISTNSKLYFSMDSVKMDTLFSNVPSAAKSFWVYNKSGSGIRCSSVRLERGNQTGFRVNVDGIYLGESVGYQTTDIEVRHKDSIRVYVELTSPRNYQDKPTLIEDNLLFVLESGATQKVNLNAFTWDALSLKNYRVSKDETISSEKPIIVYGGIEVDSAATLTIGAGTTLYFHHDAGINVRGKLVIQGNADNPVVLRGDRLDRMFDYLPYDRVSGQWQGIRFFSSSFNNILYFVDLHSAYHGILIDSTDVNQQKISINASSIHNCQGYGLQAQNAKLSIENTIISNTLNDCISIDGGDVSLNACTFVQFYPFDSMRGVALRLSANHQSLKLTCSNSLITGYGNEELKGMFDAQTNTLDYLFSNCLLRVSEDSLQNRPQFVNNIIENIKDTIISGAHNFELVDTDLLIYSFKLKKESLAIDAANQQNSPKTDRWGKERDDMPDIGADEYYKNKVDETIKGRDKL